jgi:hypothetical protein
MIGQSMMPLYTKKEQFKKTKNTAHYEMFFNHTTKKWEYTHRMVSKWKDITGQDNELTFSDLYVESEKKTIHHKNYKSYDNSPDNLVRMNQADHLVLHNKNGAIGGKIGGKVTAEKNRLLGIKPFFISNDTPERVKASARKAAATRKARGIKTGFETMTISELRAISAAGSLALQEKLQNPDFREQFGTNIKNGWGTEQRIEAGNRARLRPRSHFENMSLCGNTTRWSNDSAKVSHAKRQTVVYPDAAISIVERSLSNHLHKKQVVDALNSDHGLLAEWGQINIGNSPRHKKFVAFSGNDVNRLTKIITGESSYRTARKLKGYHNHKISAIEYLSDRMDVGTLTIDAEEKYHDHHNYALGAGIFACNSSGEVKDDKRFMSMLEDFWLPRQEGGRGTEIDTLPGGQNLGDIEDVNYFQRKLYESLKVPVSRLMSEGGGGLNFGKASEITRDELRYVKFSRKLQRQFSLLFADMLKTNCVLKNIMTEDEWGQMKHKVRIVFAQDAYYEESKEQEILKMRAETLSIMANFTEIYYPRSYIQKKVLRLTDDEIQAFEKIMQPSTVAYDAQTEKDEKKKDKAK